MRLRSLTDERFAIDPLLECGGGEQAATCPAATGSCSLSIFMSICLMRSMRSDFDCVRFRNFLTAECVRSLTKRDVIGRPRLSIQRASWVGSRVSQDPMTAVGASDSSQIVSVLKML